MRLVDAMGVASQFKEASRDAGFNRLLLMVMDDVWCHLEPLDLWRFQRDFNDGIVDMAIATNGHLLRIIPGLLSWSIKRCEKESHRRAKPTRYGSNTRLVRGQIRSLCGSHGSGETP